MTNLVEFKFCSKTNPMKLFHSIKILFFCSFIILTSCNKEDDFEDVTVSVKLIDENNNPISNRSDIDIVLSRGQETFSGVTDASGEYIFKNIPYGIFNVQLYKNGFIANQSTPELSNYENDSLHIHTFNMLEIPNYRLSIDSIIYPERNHPSYRIYAFGKITNIDGELAYQYSNRVFYNDTPDVSKDNYLYYQYGFILRSNIEGEKCKIGITDWTNGFLVPSGYDSLYLRIYPIAPYDDWITLRKEALGTPSEIFKWVIEE